MEVRITVLTDNIACRDLKGEWGLSLYIEYKGRRILLDTGASETFISNAQRLGINLHDVDYLVLSHAHYDHTRGLAAFLGLGVKAPVYLSPMARENCYAGLGIFSKYIGMPRGVVEKYPDRIIRPEGVVQISDGVYIVPHSTEGLQKLGRRNHLYVRKRFRYIPDDFSHEQTLVLKTRSGLVILNSCSHSGPEVIADEVLSVFPDEHITAYIGGLHLFRLNEKEVHAVADRMASRNIGRIYTGHCTGQTAFNILKGRFGSDIEQFHCGMQISL